ncbi:MAG: ABC transporter ATP-binding protein, partial [Lachnospiraceae bacterium]|nr:ABC transporter ATP-binding protein [Lachnospiraceae bacterium]
MEKEIKEKAVHKNVASWIVSAAARGKWPVVFLTLVQTGLSLFGVYQALTLKNLIDGAADKDRQAFLHYAVVLVLVVAAQLALRALSRFLREYSNAALENNFKKSLFASLMKRDYAQVTAVHSEEWMNRLTSDTVVVSKGITEIVPEVVGLAVKLLSALTAVLVLLHGFSWYFLLVGLLLAGSTYLFRNRLKILHKRIQESDGRLRIYLSERLSNLLVVRSFGKEEQSVREAEDLMKIHQKARMKRNHFSNFCNVGFGIVIQGMFAAAAIYCGYGILTGTFSYGAFA